MILFSRRTVFASAATLMVGMTTRKPRAAAGSLMTEMPNLQGPPGDEVPEIHFTTADGVARTLADYRGKGIVLNFWATWCVPCVAEMPALAKLAERVRDTNVAVLPLSSDRGGAPAVEKFYQQRNVEGLPVLLDPRGEAARIFGTRGIPTTVLIDRNGHERGRLEGGADWGSAEAVAAVRALAK